MVEECEDRKWMRIWYCNTIYVLLNCVFWIWIRCKDCHGVCERGKDYLIIFRYTSCKRTEYNAYRTNHWIRCFFDFALLTSTTKILSFKYDVNNLCRTEVRIYIVILNATLYQKPAQSREKLQSILRLFHRDLIH